MSFTQNNTLLTQLKDAEALLHTIPNEGKDCALPKSLRDLIGCHFEKLTEILDQTQKDLDKGTDESFSQVEPDESPVERIRGLGPVPKEPVERIIWTLKGYERLAEWCELNAEKVEDEKSRRLFGDLAKIFRAFNREFAAKTRSIEQEDSPTT